MNLLSDDTLREIGKHSLKVSSLLSQLNKRFYHALRPLLRNYELKYKRRSKAVLHTIDGEDIEDIVFSNIKIQLIRESIRREIKQFGYIYDQKYIQKYVSDISEYIRNEFKYQLYHGDIISSEHYTFIWNDIDMKAEYCKTFSIDRVLPISFKISNQFHVNYWEGLGINFYYNLDHSIIPKKYKQLHKKIFVGVTKINKIKFKFYVDLENVNDNRVTISVEDTKNICELNVFRRSDNIFSSGKRSFYLQF